MNTYNINEDVFFIDFSIEGGKLKNDVIKVIKLQNDIVWYELNSGITIKQDGIICKLEQKEYALAYFTTAINQRLQETSAYIQSL